MFTLLTTALVLTINAPAPANDVAAPAAPAAPGAAPAAGAPEVKLVFGHGVSEREVLPFDEGTGPIPGETLYAWMEVKGFDGATLDHVWLRDGKEVARHTMKIGSPKRWRSWSHMRLRAGSYEVKVIGPDGVELAKQEMTVGIAHGDEE